MARVELAHVDKVFDSGTKVVCDLSLDIADHEFLVLVGPSGCGKSTTLRMIAGLESVSAGTIRIDGQVVNDVPPKDRDIAMVFQSYALYPHMTVYQNLAFALGLRRVPRAVIDEKVRSTAKTLGIEGLLDRTPKQLSGGQRQRVAVGRAIVRDPKCFLFDEPLSNLDAKLRLETRAELKRLHHQLASTTIYVTHDQEEAITLGDRVVVMKGGVVQQCASPLEVYRHPVNRFVAGFLGNPPMNFLEGRLEALGDGLVFNEGSKPLRVDGSMLPGLRQWVGEELVMGVRPEALSDERHARFPTSENNCLPTVISLVQPLGDRMNVHLLTTHHSSIVAQVDADLGISHGQPYALHVDMSRVHFFEKGDDGRNLVLLPTPASS